MAVLEEEVARLDRFQKELTDLGELGELARGDDKLVSELEERCRKLEEEIKNEELKTFLAGKYDKNKAILQISAGAGGNDAEDWTAMLWRMYEHWAEKNNFGVRVLYCRFGEGGGPEGRIGVKEVSLEINGDFAYGWLKKESGGHRLVRLSPFSAKNLRHTSFAKVEVLPVIEEKDAEIKIKPEDLKIETFRSSGPGGQNVNRRETAVRITHLPTGIKAEAQIERFQAANRKIAMEILLSRIVALKEEEKKREVEKIKDSEIGGGKEKRKIAADFGGQIRSYIFHPYKLVKDHRTGVATSEAEGVLDGDLNKFLEAEIRINS